jgi:hypothetical protein
MAHGGPGLGNLHETLGPAFTFSAPALAWVIIIYGAIASMLPVWSANSSRPTWSGAITGGARSAAADRPVVTLDAARRLP